MSTMFDLALQAHGPPYVSLELDLVRAAQLDPAEAAWLREQQARPDPAASLLAAVVLSWVGPKGDDYRRALEYLEQVPIEYGADRDRIPAPRGVLKATSRSTSPTAWPSCWRCACIKEPEWPQWKGRGHLVPAGAQGAGDDLEPSIRFAIETRRMTSASWRSTRSARWPIPSCTPS